MFAYNLALAYEHLRNYPESRRWLGTGLELEPDDQSLQRLELRVRFLELRHRVLNALGRLAFWRG
jgi:hypothetical protein